MISYTTQICRKIMSRPPNAVAVIKGDEKHKDINGKVMFYTDGDGTVVVAEIYGLPHSKGNCTSQVFGFHIHSGDKCSGTPKDPFANTKGHFNPENCHHPQHAGDLPPLFENNGFAWNAVYTDRFRVKQIIGKTVVIHGMPDDFATQPSGNSGEKIACGVIR